MRRADQRRREIAAERQRVLECSVSWKSRAVSRLYEETTVERLESELRAGCAICGDQDIPNLHADHDHATGYFRGWLCRGCNHGLGNFRDDPSSLRRAAEYLVERSIMNIEHGARVYGTR